VVPSASVILAADRRRANEPVTLKKSLTPDGQCARCLQQSTGQSRPD
jgi:hypothetical protein